MNQTTSNAIGITNAVFEGLAAVTKTVTDVIDIADVVAVVKNAIHDFYALALAAVILLIIFVAGMAAAMGVTAAATWRTSKLVEGTSGMGRVNLSEFVSVNT